MGLKFVKPTPNDFYGLKLTFSYLSLFVMERPLVSLIVELIISLILGVFLLCDGRLSLLLHTSIFSDSLKGVSVACEARRLPRVVISSSLKVMLLIFSVGGLDL